MSGRVKRLRNQSELRLLPDPSGDPQVLALGALQMFEILLQRRFIELGEKLGLNRCVVLTNLVDELTFTHRVFSFAKLRMRTGLQPVDLHTHARVPGKGIGSTGART